MAGLLWHLPTMERCSDVVEVWDGEVRAGEITPGTERHCLKR
uniref:Uncharacterized protein n=1 Tax=Ciona intestinalis TaxID=7719 RepID=H2Y3L0_CIOIN